MIPSFLLSLLEITGTMSLLILALLLFTRLWGSRYTARCRYVLWTLVILRMCIPVGFPFLPALLTLPVPETLVESVQTAVTETEPTQQAPCATTPDSPETTATSSVPTAPAAPGESPAPAIPPMPSEATASDPPIVEGPPTSPIPTESPNPAPYTELITRFYQVAPILFGIWLTVAALLFALRLIGYGVFTGKLRRSLSLPDENRQAFCDKLGLTLGLGKRQLPKIYRTAEVHSPMLCGYLRPIVLLPDIPLTDNQLTGVLAHELTHRRRQDLWLKAACLLAASLHWFNPLVYIAAGRCNREMELSCDELVLSGMDDEVRLAYGKVMLDIVKRCARPFSDLTTHYTPKKSAVTERFAAILDGSLKRQWTIAALFVLVISLAAGSVFALRPAMQTENLPLDTAETAVEPIETQEKQPDSAELQSVNVTLTPVETIAGTPSHYDVALPDRIEGWNVFTESDQTPVRVLTTMQPYDLIRTNQFTNRDFQQEIFAATGAVLEVQNPAYAYVFRNDPDVGWLMTRLYTGQKDVACKGVVLHRRPRGNGERFLLAMLCDDGVVRIHYSEDGYAWLTGAELPLPTPDSYPVQFSSYSGLGSETLCIAYGGGAGTTVYLSFDDGDTFTRYDLPLLDAFPGDWREARFVSRSSGAGSGEFMLEYQLIGPEESRRLQVVGFHGSNQMTLLLHPEPYEPNDGLLHQIRYTSAEDLGFLSEAVPGYEKGAEWQFPKEYLSGFYKEPHTVSAWHVELEPTPHLTVGGRYNAPNTGGADGMNYLIFEEHPAEWHQLLRNDEVQILLDYADVATRRDGIPVNGYFPTWNAPASDGMTTDYGLFDNGTINQDICWHYTISRDGEEIPAVYEKIRLDDGTAVQTYHIYSIAATDRHLLRYVIAGDLPMNESAIRTLTGRFRLLEFPPGDLH